MILVIKLNVGQFKIYLKCLSYAQSPLVPVSVVSCPVTAAELSPVPGDRQLWPGTMAEVRREDPNDFHIPPGYPPTPPPPPPPSTMDRCHKMGRTPRTRLPRLFSPFLTAAFSHRMVVAGMTLPVRLE